MTSEVNFNSMRQTHTILAGRLGDTEEIEITHYTYARLHARTHTLTHSLTHSLE